MDWHERSIRMGAVVIVLAVLLRLYGTGAFEAVGAALWEPEVGSLLLYLETGRVVRPATETDPPTTELETVPETTAPARQPVTVTFSREDEAMVYVRGTSTEPISVETLLETPLELDLFGTEPTVLILHTHATESYTQTAGAEYTESSAYRTLDPDHNMVAIGARVEELLEAGGITVVRSETLHDYPEYTGGYDRSRVTAEEYLARYPSIQLILDLHRDSAVDSNGNEFDTSAQVNGQESAQLMLLMSTGYDGWESNMNLAVKLTALLEKTHPGVTRGILTRNSLYNQDLGPGAMLVEVGAAGNTLAEAMCAAEVLADAILALAGGTK